LYTVKRRAVIFRRNERKVWSGEFMEMGVRA
jgi:hypothetical protein